MVSTDPTRAVFLPATVGSMWNSKQGGCYLHLKIMFCVGPVHTEGKTKREDPEQEVPLPCQAGNTFLGCAVDKISTELRLLL